MSLADKWKAIPLNVKISVAYAVCSILQKCLSFITLPLFTRLLTTEQYGQFTVYSSWSGVLSIFLTLNLAFGSFSAAMIKFEDKRDSYISSVQGICLLLTGLFLAIYFPFRNQLNVIFELPTAMVVLLVAEVLFATTISLWSGKKRFEFKYKSVVAVTLLISVISPVIAFLLVSASEEKGYARIMGYAIVTVLTGGFFFVKNLIKGKQLFNREFWKYALGFNIPLLAYYLSQVVFNQSDKIMISHLCGIDKAALYGVAYSLAMILNFILNAINNSYVPWFYGKIKENRTEANQSVSAGIALLLAFMLLSVIWFAPEIILIMAGEAYTEATLVVAPVAMSVLLLFYSQLFINVEFFYEEKKHLVWSSIGAALLNIVLNGLLIPVFGFVVAGYTTLLSYFVFAGANNISMRQILKKRGLQDKAYNYMSLIGIMVGFILSGFLGVLLYNYLLWRIVITGIVCMLLMLNYRSLLDVLKELKTK